MNYSNNNDGQGLIINSPHSRLTARWVLECPKESFREKTFNNTRALVANFVRMKKYFPFFVLFIFLAGCSGKDNLDEINCTEEFRVIGVTVSGGVLGDFYTVRSSTYDTIRYSDNQNYPVGRWYPVLDDGYQVLLEGKEEDFYFVGIVGGVKVINQHYIIGADRCHIYKKLGPESVVI